MFDISKEIKRYGFLKHNVPLNKTKMKTKYLLIDVDE
jgi:hypothetical protein